MKSAGLRLQKGKVFYGCWTDTPSNRSVIMTFQVEQEPLKTDAEGVVAKVIACGHKISRPVGSTGYIELNSKYTFYSNSFNDIRNELARKCEVQRDIAEENMNTWGKLYDKAFDYKEKDFNPLLKVPVAPKIKKKPHEGSKYGRSQKRV